MAQVLNPTIVTNPATGRIRPYDVAQELMAQLPIRQCGETFYVHNGRAYAPVTVDQLKRYVMEICRSSVQKEGSPKLIDQVIAFLKDEGRIEMSEVDRGFVSFCNGLLRLADGKLLPHTAGIFSTARVEANYAPQLAGQHPLFSRFLSQVSGGDATLEQRIWQMIGYALVPDTNAKAFFLLQGVPNSGKSLLGEFLTRLMPLDAVTSLSLNDLGRNFGPSELVGKLLCLSMDLPAMPWDSKAVGMLKALTGNDLVTADVKYQPRAKFRNSATFLFGTNHAVTLTQSDPAFLQRLVVIPSRHTVPREQQDRQLLEKLLTERDAIVVTAIRAYWGLRQANYVFAGDFRLNEVIARDDQAAVPLSQAVAEFVCADCVLEPNAETFTADLHRAFSVRYPGTSYTAFAAQLVTYLDNTFPGKVAKHRSRRPGEVNPISLLKGIRLRDEPGILSTTNCIL
jgi:putative DNA primase/helicase